METVTIHLADEAATIALGRQLAALARPGDVIALHGTLGMGKSTLARAFIRALTRQDEDVPSPTFTLVQMYEGASGDLWHFDLYRLDKPEDAFELGIEDAFVDGVSLIEWPDRLGRLMPRQRLELHLHPGGKATSRKAELISHEQWDDRLKDMTA